MALITDKAEPLFIDGFKEIAVRAMWLNIGIILILTVSKLELFLGAAGGVVLILYLSVASLQGRERAFFLLFAIKLTFDALWEIKIEGMPVGLMELIFIPFCFLLVFGERITARPLVAVVRAVGFYLLLVLSAMIVNQSFRPEVLAKQAGMLVGMLLGLKYLKSRRHLNTLFAMIFLSTILPIMLSSLQLVPGGDTLAFLHFKFDSSRLIRPSGLYYDSATAGMMCIISMVSNLYLLNGKMFQGIMKMLQWVLAPLSFALIIVGGTRSIIAVSSLILAFFFLKRLRFGMLFAPFLLLTLIVFQPYLDRVVARSSTDMPNIMQFRQMMDDPDSRTLLTGRVGLWQDSWSDFRTGSFFQQYFGSGKASNAHSTFFFLLLQVGWLGLFYFLALNLGLLLKIWRSAGAREFKYLGLIALVSFLLVSISLTAVAFSTFQWAVYLIAGGVLRLGAEAMHEGREAI